MLKHITEDFSQYKHFVSLGGNCFVAEDLAHLGLRDCSYPFDWLFSDDFSGVVSAIENNFDEFLSEELLFQHKTNRSRYYNSKYKLSFYHDFNKYLPLKKQLDEVKAKYNKRIKRFFDDISEPTVFFRYVICKNDYDYIAKECRNIEILLKSFCHENKIIYLVHHDVLEKNSVDCRLIDKDFNDWISRTPLQKNADLKNELTDFYFLNRDKNIEFNKAPKQKPQKGISLEKTLRRMLKKNLYIIKSVNSDIGRATPKRC